jgi:hypothetical protein
MDHKLPNAETAWIPPEKITDSSFWHKDSGRAAAYGSMKGFRDLAGLIEQAYE